MKNDSSFLESLVSKKKKKISGGIIAVLQAIVHAGFSKCPLVIRVVKGCSRHVREFLVSLGREMILTSMIPSSSIQSLCCLGEFF